MHDDDGASFGRGAPLDFSWVQVERCEVYVREDRPRANGAYRGGCGHKCETWKQDFVARAYAARAQRQNERIRAGGHAYAMRHAAQPGDLLLEHLSLLAENELLRRQNV